jgi:hypothetical protein
MMPNFALSTPCKNTESGVEKIFANIWVIGNMTVFSYKQSMQLAEVFNRWGVEYLFIGKSAAVFYGFPDTTQVVDIFPSKSLENRMKLVSALDKLGYELIVENEKGPFAKKALVQLRSGPFDLDLVFAPDGIETFTEAKSRSLLIDGRFPVASLDDIIASKRAANRQKDRESLPRLEAFHDYLRSRNLAALPTNPANS